MRGLVLATRIRSDEKLLFDAFARRKIACDIADLRQVRFELGIADHGADFVVNRSIAQTEGLSAVSYFEVSGTPTVNTSEVIACCGDKARMSLAFAAAGLPFPKTTICYSSDSALEAAANIGFPVVLKPVIGSWGRMVVKLDDLQAARAVFAYKDHLTNLHHKIYYLQQYIEKPGRDIRAIVIGDHAVCTYYRCSDDWVTNVHLGGVGARGAFSEQVTHLAVQAARAVGGGAVSVDLFEDRSGAVLVNEVNHTMEFTEATKATGIDIADHYAAYCEAVAK